MAQSFSLLLTKIRNLLINGAVGTVTRYNVMTQEAAVEDLLEKMQGRVSVNNALKPLMSFHYAFAPANASTTSLLAFTDQGAAVTNVTTFVAQPDVPRFLQIDGSAAGIAGNVVITGTNIAGSAISETIALNGLTAVPSTKAFKSISAVQLPIQTHTPVYQVETATAVGTITLAGDATVIVTAAGVAGSPITFNVAVGLGDLPAVWAALVRTALNGNVPLTDAFTVGGTGADITLTRKTYAADDATLNISLDNGTCTGITQDLTSTDTAAGVARDQVSLGYTNVFGLPHILANAWYCTQHLFEGSNDAGTVTVNAALEKNVYAIAGTPNGAKIVDLVYLA